MQSNWPSCGSGPNRPLIGKQYWRWEMSSAADQPLRPLSTESAADIRALFVLCTGNMRPAALEPARRFVIRHASFRQIPLSSSTESNTPTGALLTDSVYREVA